MKVITTSWDDGYPADDRLAELLEKHNLRGTFYIPRTNKEHVVMEESNILPLSQKFEIGGHTINHNRLSSRSESLFKEEIAGCYIWLTGLLGQAPTSFCFPGGEYTQPAIVYAQAIGFKILRTTELLNPNISTGPGLVPTTLQLFHHSTFTYTKHLIKRLKLQSLGIYLKSKSRSRLTYLVEYYLNHILEHGGCLHLWGHSWEIEQFNLWQETEQIFKLISNINECNYVTNGELLNINETSR